MTVTLFFVVTVLLESTFIYLGLWLIARWLKAADEEEAVAKAVHELEESGCADPHEGCCPAYDELSRLAA